MTTTRQHDDYHRWIQEFAADRFDVRGSTIFCDNHSLLEFASQHLTPCYLTCESLLQRRWQSLQATFPSPFEIYYSIKANPNQTLLRYFLDRQCGLEIASLGELHLALHAGCPPSKLVFAGPGKRDDELRAAITHGIGEIHVESINEIKRLQHLAQHQRKQVSIALRINPSLASAVGSLQMGGKPTQFGIDEELLADAAELVERHCPQLELVGLHLNTGTQLLDANTLLGYYRHAVDVATKLADILERPLSTLDFGGGLGVPYHQNQAPLDLNAVHQGLLELVAFAAGDTRLRTTRLMIEPGRFLVAESGLYVTQVVDIKQSRGETFVVLDGGMHHHLAATGNFGQTLKRPFPIAHLSRLDSDQTEIVTIVGPLCTPLDTLARRISFPVTQVGDYLAVLQSGAYARTASPLHFLGHASPAEYWLSPTAIKQTRRQGKWQDELADQADYA